jgi:ribosomal protein L40E
MNCELEKDELTGKFICKICGVKLPVNAQINCRMKRKQAENKPPPLVQRVANFASAATAHAAAGNPKVTKEVMQERLAICRSCPLFKPNKNEVG